MRRALFWTWTSAALCAVCLAVLLDWQARGDATTVDTCQHGGLFVMVPQHQHHQEATLTDASQLYRICSSRPQRILPTHGAKTERTITPAGSLALRQRKAKSLYSYHDSRCRQEAAPFCASASSDYYVIALRHIIR